jgi:hypothetical protein
MKYPFLKWQWIFFLIRRICLSFFTGKNFTGLMRNSNCLSFMSAPVILMASMHVAHLHSLLHVVLCFFAKGKVIFCHHLASVFRRLSSVNISHYNLLLRNRLNRNLVVSIYGRFSIKIAHFVPIR